MDSIVLHDLTLGYDRHPAVHHLSGEFVPGSMTAARQGSLVFDRYLF